jgi:hypothetical protein
MGVVLMVARGIPNPKVAVRVRTPMPNTGIRKVWLIRLLWEQKIASSNLASPTNH